MNFLIEEVTTGLLDGIYLTLEGAEEAQRQWQKQYSDMTFLIKLTFRKSLHESELLAHADFHNRI